MALPIRRIIEPGESSDNVKSMVQSTKNTDRQKPSSFTKCLILMMFPRFVSRSLRLFFCLFILCSSFTFSGCEENAPPDETFPAPDYDYLPHLNLDVAQLNVIDQTSADAQDPQSLIAQDPISPTQALSLMAHQRLHPTGNDRQGHFIITQANITSGPNYTLYGHFTVRLTLDDTSQNHHGSITASVSRESQAADNVTQRHHLFTFTQQMMNDMNVELEYQIRKNLGDWLTDATGTPLNSSVQSQPLEQPAPTDSPLPTPNTSISPSSQNTAPKSANAAPQATTAFPASTIPLHSPPPDVLHLP